MLGGVILVVILAIASGVFFIQDIMRLFHPTFSVVALMGQAGALESGSHVWIAGRPVGLVKSVVIRGADVDSTERVAVTMQIPRGYQQHVRKDSRVRLTSARLIGEPVLDISPGSPAAPVVDDLDSLRSSGPGSVEGLMNAAMGVSNGMHALFASMHTMTREGSQQPQQMAQINRNLADISGQFHQLTLAMANGPSSRLNDPAFRAAIADLRGMSGQFGAELRGAAGRARKARADAEPALRLMAARADTIQAQLGLVQQRIADGGGGLLIRAQKDSAIMKAVHGAQLQLDSLIAVTKRKPWRFWF